MRRDPAAERKAMQDMDAVIVQLVREYAQSHSRQAEELSRQAGVELAPWALVLLAKLENTPMRVTELSAKLGLAHPTLSRRVQDLERKGLIERSEDSADGRAAILTLSARGLVVASVSRAMREEWLTQIFDGRGDGTRRFLIELSLLVSKMSDVATTMQYKTYADLVVRPSKYRRG